MTITRSFLCAAFLGCLSLLDNKKPEISVNQLQLKQLDEEIVGSQPYVEQSSINGVVILNGPDRKIHVVRDGHLIQSFGSLGTGPGELYNPVIAANDKYFVDVEPFTQRVQWFRSDGSYQHTCHISSSLDTRTAALTNDNTLILNDSHDISPIVLMNSDCVVEKRIGSRLRVSDLYETNNTSRDALYKDASNRGNIATDDKYIYIAYSVAPVVSKYDRNGNLLYRINLTHTVDKTFWSYSPGSGGISTGVDGTQIPIISSGISVDPLTGKLWVLTAEDLKSHAQLFSVSADGKRILSYQVTSPDPAGNIQKMAVYKNTLYVSLVFAHGAYDSPLPPN